MSRHGSRGDTVAKRLIAVLSIETHLYRRQDPITRVFTETDTDLTVGPGSKYVPSSVRIGLYCGAVADFSLPSPSPYTIRQRPEFEYSAVQRNLRL